MARATRRSLPSEDEVWTRVREFAEQHERSEQPLQTLSKGFGNRIAKVTDDGIQRVSTKKRRENGSQIGRDEVLRVWRHLLAHGDTRGLRPTYFTLALLEGAMRDVIEHVGGSVLTLRGQPSSPAPRRTYSYAEAASIALTSRTGDARPDFELRESNPHWRIKHYIHQCPNEALEALSGGPWTEAVLELPLRVPTKDRIDVVVRGADRRYVLIEVKPRVGDGAQRLYAQAAKYRAIWQVLHDLEPGDVRCVLAAPKIPKDIARYMFERHQIESVEVRVPRGFVAPLREPDE